jgi:RimJ/RimL family protein N-acetyltransferase
MFPEVALQPPERGDVQRLVQWLDDDEVNSLWYGRGLDSIPLHIGYSPHRILRASETNWQQVFEDTDRKVFAIYTTQGVHIGEGQLEIEWVLQEAQLFILIGRKDLWHQHYGTMALVQLLDQAYESYELHRVWADIPEYNEHALEMFDHLGFVLEGHLRKTHRKDDEWYDSSAVGLLVDEYRRRRTRFMENPTP